MVYYIGKFAKKKQKMSKNKIQITGDTLSLAEIQLLTQNPASQIQLSSKVLANAKKSFDFVQKNLDKEVIYGINTGFGPMASHVLGKTQLLELQRNLIVSHAAGMGSPIDTKLIRAIMVVRLNTLAKGYSGVSPDLLRHLEILINKNILPLIPEHGSVGASGDLVQLAHIALAIIGQGKAFYQDSWQDVSAIYKKLGVRPYTLAAKEGLSLINGTAAMTGIGALVTTNAQRLIHLSTTLGALALELVCAYDDSISSTLHNLRPHRGQLYISEMLQKLLAESTLLKNRKTTTEHIHLRDDVQELPEAIQEVYSLRCIAQILGPAYEAVRHTAHVVTTEMNAVTDNPIVDVTKKTFLHGGNFHGDYVASGMDQLKAGIIKLTMLSERRINYFLNQKINKRFPPFLNLKKPGLTLGLQALQFTATSTTAMSQSLGFPHHLHSIPTNGDNQDIVSMGTEAALIAAETIENAYIVLAIEAVTLCQAADYLNISKKLSPSIKKLYTLTRDVVPTVHEDRVLSEEMNSLVRVLKTNEIF